MSYKKRGRAGWVGRKEAKSKIRRERNYAKSEIRQELRIVEEGEDFRYKHKSKKILTNKQKIEKRLAWYERVLEEWTRPNREAQWKKYDHDSWFGRYVNSLRDKAKKLKKELESYED